MRIETPAQRAFWAERQRLGLGVGMDEEGNLVFPLVRMPPSATTLQ